MATLKGEQTVLNYATNLVTPVYAAVGPVVSLSWDGRAVDDVPLSAMGDSAKTYRPGTITEPGTINFSVYLDFANTAQQAILDAVATPAVWLWQLEYSDGTSDEAVQGYVKDVGISQMGNSSNEVLMTVNVKLSGAVTTTTA